MSVMYVATRDILTENGGFNPQAARAIGEAIDLEIARARDLSATKDDVSECRRALSEELGALRVDADRGISAVRSELTVLRTEVKGELAALRTELKGDIGALRTELKGDIGALRTELKEDIGAVRTGFKVDQQTLKADLFRWVFVAIMGQSAMLLGVLYFFMKYFK